MWNLREPQTAKTILKKKNKAGRLTLSDFKTYCICMVIKTMWYWHEDRHTDQWNRIEAPKINPQMYCQVDFVKGAKIIQWGKNSLFHKYSWNKRLAKNQVGPLLLLLSRFSRVRLCVTP